MVSVQFREDVGKTEGTIALLIALTGVVFAAVFPGITVILTVLVLLVNLWLLYLVYRLLMAVEEIAYQS
ncbi:uncharacterized protein Nmag_2839 [Natrialba magadii ATCC 43099]|uniref:Uncharacterized protein n=1 Tax=Natrialba magadii (strain ATCC 43099 / DSM 3394 / CCM 3739 / CIP 104546 / IAM 13178 / JCM 8861 / NBRC 102185 / NCIMB 2190 / MS3) TaxID=547559 RepID=D3SZY2_NATMM|nr:hypothetical protein [Natrialba magadii]ADD06392.1 uncharacterized protein Nmag_2839 [Natrialba magadii ATCC 43099]ELY31580.1 hypothetical protein C500_06204 [Natrialba magadii ATCC 43099]